MTIELTPELAAILDDNSYTNVRVLPDGRICGLLKMMFTTGLCVDLDEDAYAYRYCYATTREASVALAAWDGTGDPPGPWIKRKGLGGDVRGPGSPEV